MFSILKRAWIPLVVAVAIALGGVAVSRLRGVFGSEQIFTATGSSAEPLEPSHLKRVTYEVYGPSDTTGSVSYLNKNAQPEQANFASLPWTYTITTTVPAVSINCASVRPTASRPPTASIEVVQQTSQSHLVLLLERVLGVAREVGRRAQRLVGRIEVHEIDRCVPHVPAKDVEVVAKVQGIRHDVGDCPTRAS